MSRRLRGWLAEAFGVPFSFLATRLVLPLACFPVVLVIAASPPGTGTADSFTAQRSGPVVVGGGGTAVGDKGAGRMGATGQADPDDTANSRAVGLGSGVRPSLLADRSFLSRLLAIVAAFAWPLWGAIAVERRGREILRARFDSEPENCLVDWRYAEGEHDEPSSFLADDGPTIEQAAHERRRQRRHIVRGAMCAGVVLAFSGCVKFGVVGMAVGGLGGASALLAVASIRTASRRRARVGNRATRLRVLRQGLLFGDELVRFRWRLRAAWFDPCPRPRICLVLEATSFHDETVQYPVPEGCESEAVRLCNELRRIAK